MIFEQFDILYIYPYFMTKTEESEYYLVIIPRIITAGRILNNQ